MSDSTSPGTSRARNRNAHRACDYCRQHRRRCVYEKDSEECKHCLDFDIPCEKIAPPPEDSRPRKRQKGAPSKSQPSQGIEPSYLGSTSIPQLVWAFCLPSARGRLHALDVDQSFFRGAICDAEEHGLLVGREETFARHKRAGEIALDTAQARLAESVGGQSVLTDLYETASTRIIPVFPIVSKHESLLEDAPDQRFWERFVEHHHNSLPPTPLPRVVRLIHYALAAMSREVPASIRDNVLATLHSHLRGGEFQSAMQISVMSNVQILVLLSMCEELNDDDGTSTWLKLGTGLRMAQEMALHRNVGLDFVPLAQRNRRTRVWGACICADRWTTLRRGQSMLIDLDMCDAPPPQEYPDHVRENTSGRWTPAFRFLSEFTKLSVLLGRVYQALCTPRGLKKADDVTLLVLQTDIDLWYSQLPLTFPYSPTLEITEAPQLLNMFFVAVEFTFYRPFFWPSAPIPPHVIFRPSPQKWPEVVSRAKQAVMWAETPGGTFYLDVWTVIIYPLVCCFLIHLKFVQQTHASDKQWVNRSEAVISNWAAQLPSSTERKEIASMIRMLKDTVEQDQEVDPLALSLNMLTPGGSFNQQFFDMLQTPTYSLDNVSTSF